MSPKKKAEPAASPKPGAAKQAPQKGKPSKSASRTDVGQSPAEDDLEADDLFDIDDDEVRDFVNTPDAETGVPEIVAHNAAEEEEVSAPPGRRKSHAKGWVQEDRDFEPKTQRDREQEKRFKYKVAARLRKGNRARQLQKKLDRERDRQDLGTPLGAMEAKERSGEGLKRRIAARNTALLVAMSEILDATTEPDSDKRDSMTIMSRQLRTQFNTQQIVRSCEDLLTMIRWMQERWLCGNLNTIGQSGVEAETEKDAREIVELLKRLDGTTDSKQENRS